MSVCIIKLIVYDQNVTNARLGCYKGMTGVLDEDIINEGVIDTIEQFLQRYDVFVCIIQLMVYDWDVTNARLGCYKGKTGVLDEDIINEGVIDTIEQLLQRYDVCMYYKVDCV